MNHKTNVIIIIVLGILITSFGYVIDTDPVYPNIWHSIIEFVILSMFISGVLATPYVIFWMIRSKLAKKS